MSITVKEKNYSKEVLRDSQYAQLRYVSAAGILMQSYAKALAPVDTGNLRSSIQTTAYVEDGQATSEIAPTAEYAPYLEYGTGIYAEKGSISGDFIGQEAQPFMWPAWEKIRNKLPELQQRYLPL